MIKVTVMYPSGEDITFNEEYYLNSHMPMVRKLVGEAMQNEIIERGVAGGMPGSSPAYSHCVSMFFESSKSFNESFGPHAPSIMADIPNYTNANPTVLISKVI